MKIRMLAALVLCAAGTLGAPGLASAQPAPAAAMAQTKNDYADPKTWLCLPGRQDACSQDENATIVRADGTTALDPYKPAVDPGIDCFYVYPTVSRDKTANSDMNAGPEELSVIKQQFARFGSVCRTYAPLYRQVTLTALQAGMVGHPMKPDRILAYEDVKDAWNYYLEHDNHGRGVVLIGHSQGSGVLIALVKNEIDGKPIQSKIVSVILGGARLQCRPARRWAATSSPSRSARGRNRPGAPSISRPSAKPARRRPTACSAEAPAPGWRRPA
jgi:hypothetical protein